MVEPGRCGAPIRLYLSALTVLDRWIYIQACEIAFQIHLPTAALSILQGCYFLSDHNIRPFCISSSHPSVYSLLRIAVCPSALYLPVKCK